MSSPMRKLSQLSTRYMRMAPPTGHMKVSLGTGETQRTMVHGKSRFYGIMEKRLGNLFLP